MTESLLNSVIGDRILEIGTGCGYQTAVLSPFFKEIYSIERIRSLLQKTKQRLRAIDIYNVNFRHGDGWQGWSKYGPYDGIIVAAAAPELPIKLLEQLALNGSMSIPIGGSNEQKLMIVTRNQDHYESKDLGSVSFVPLIKED
jgi:protein-L-isoaspartate(D-aspartate) O-methyltransferase